MKTNMYASLMGLAVGDALGVPVEFRSRSSLRADPVVSMRSFGTHNQPQGTWSDDTSMALCFIESFLAKGWDPGDQASRYLRWLSQGHLTPFGVCFDSGPATQRALLRYSSGSQPLEAGGRAEGDNGNGSLMRILPAALLLAGCPDEMLLRGISMASSVTHAHGRSKLACLIYSLVVSEILAGETPLRGSASRKTAGAAVESAVRRFEGLRQKGILPEELESETGLFARILSGNLAELPESEIRSDGYVLSTLEASLWCLLTTSNYRDCVLKAVNLGEDTDTTGAVAGGLAGLLYGLESIPWTDTLVGKADLEKMFREFTERVRMGCPFQDSYWVLPGKILAGEYPGDLDERKFEEKIENLLDSGVSSFIDLTEEGETSSGKPLKPYADSAAARAQLRKQTCSFDRIPIRDASAPSETVIREIHRVIDDRLNEGHCLYLHCWGGRGRTGVAVGTWLIEKGFVSGKRAAAAIGHLRRNTGDANQHSPETAAQHRLLETWTPSPHASFPG